MVFFFLFAPVSTSNYSIMNDHALPPKVVILSFMVVSAGCLISFFFVLASLVLLPIVFESSFPGVHEVMNLEKDQFNEALAADPHSVLLQTLIAGEIADEFRWMILISMFAMAGGVLLGGNLGYRDDPPSETDFSDEE